MTKRVHNIPKRLWDIFRSSPDTALTGLLISALGIVFLIWNECQVVKTSHSTYESLLSIVSPETQNVNTNESNSKLVHFTGSLQIPRANLENDYAISISVVNLARKMEMYQWVEDEAEQVIEDYDYRYSKQWRDELINSSSFVVPINHTNPAEFPKTFINETHDVDVDVDDGTLAFHLREKWKTSSPDLLGFLIYPPIIAFREGFYYNRVNETNPEIGDLRIQFSNAGKSDSEINIIGFQEEHVLTSYKTDSGDTVLVVRSGNYSLDDILRSKNAQNWVDKWVYRVCGFYVLYIGCIPLTRMICVLHDSNHVLRDIVENYQLSTGTTAPSASIILTVFVGVMVRLWYNPSLLSILGASIILPFICGTVIRKLTNVVSLKVENF